MANKNKDRSKVILNTPNILALSRVFLAPLMFLFLVNRDLDIFQNVDVSWLNYISALIFVIASVTDFFDGYIARMWNQKTEFGAIIDPLADKMLMLAGFIGLMILDRANPWAIYLILTREFFITGLRVSAISQGKDISASFIGKVKTVVQMIAIGFLMMDWIGGDLLLWGATLITLYSGFEYTRDFFKE